ncbi:MAG: peptide ABC transporter substrate-binding protein [Defluviitaleaceae bacterium]|nr:peptide ABC transporter substrate-binding protein [Defluviitaleaceae bacterium]
MVKKPYKKIIFLLFTLIFLSGCFETAEIAEQFQVVPVAYEPLTYVVQAEDLTRIPLSGGTLNLSMRRPHTLNPILNEDRTVDAILRLLFEPLAVFDENQRPIPNLAEDINFASDGLSVVITLKEGLLWSDGTPITSQDIIFTLNLMRNAPEYSVYKRNIRNMQSFEPIDNLSVRITYYEAFHEAFYMLMFPIIPVHYYRNETNPGSIRNMHPVGSGAFQFVRYDNMRTLYLERNESFFGGRSYIDNVTVTITPDFQTDLFAAEQGVIDALVVDFDIWRDYGAGRGINVHEFDAPLFEFIGFNFERPRMNNLNVRRAVAHSVDLDAIAVNVYHTHAQITKTVMHPNSWLYEENVAAYPFDLETASYFLNQSGASFSKYYPVTIIVNLENEERVRTAEMLSDALNEIGIYNNVEALLFFEYSDLINRGEYDIVVGGFYLGLFPDFTFMLHSSENILNYGSDYMDSLLAIAKMSGTETTFRRAMSDIQKEVCEDLPLISVAYRNRLLLTNMRIHGEMRPVINNPFNNVHEWFIYYEAR